MGYDTIEFWHGIVKKHEALSAQTKSLLETTQFYEDPDLTEEGDVAVDNLTYYYSRMVEYCNMIDRVLSRIDTPEEGYEKNRN